MLNHSGIWGISFCTENKYVILTKTKSLWNENLTAQQKGRKVNKINYSEITKIK